MSKRNLRQKFTTPIGRFVGGSLTEQKTTDAEGMPMVYKSGPKAGQPRATYDFALAIPKVPGAHWATQPADWNEAELGKYYGAVIWAVGHAAFPNGQAQRPDFAWKITDGDSTIPNKKGRKPVDNPGYAGCWVLWFSSEIAPRTFNSNGTVPVDPASIKCGHYIQVCGSVNSNDSDNQPGVYLNHELVAHSGFGEEIIRGTDPAQAGFGKAKAPPGMSATPVGGLPAPAAPSAGLPPAPGAPAPTAAPAVPQATPAATPAAVTPAAALPPAPTPVVPNTGFLNGAPAPPAAPVAPSGPVMTPKAGGTPYAAFIAKGWTDDTLRANGYIQ
jgi:hypothetical protein